MLWKNLTAFFGIAVAFLCYVSAFETNKIFKHPLKSKHKKYKPSPDNDEALFLTPYIKSGKLDEARKLSQVGKIPNVPDLTSYSGFFTVNEKYNSNLFFWFFPAVSGDANTPTVLWLQGGPGMSGLFGLFVEHGPYAVDANLTVTIKPYHWAKSLNVIYIDNPVGTGFSFTDNDSAYPTNQEMVSKDLYSFLQQFFTVFSEYRSTDFYIAGEGYGGKFAPSLALKIHNEGPASNINLKGVAIGNGFCDPESMLDYSPYFYELGLIDKKQAITMENLSYSIKEHLVRKEYYQALLDLNKMIVPFKVLPTTSLFENYTGFEYFYNYFMTREPEEFNYYKKFIDMPPVRKAIHVGNLAFQTGEMAQKNLLNDIMKGVKQEIAVIMDNYKVLFYNGQLDLTIPYPLTLNFLHSIRWKGADEYANAERGIWRLHDGGRGVGYVHKVGDFYELLSRDSGQLLAYDQPELSLDIMVRFVYDYPYF